MINCSALSCLAWPNRVRTCCDQGKQFFVTYLSVFRSFPVDPSTPEAQNLEDLMCRSAKVVFPTFNRFHEACIVNFRSRIPANRFAEFLASKKPNILRIIFGRCVLRCAENMSIND
ncbi:hypothetical protein WH47_03383 [Habropoda laboriosa]|uniref:Uncharacterized protein n=1 Tax=Habropoda laboriosa TaxID=597456 RepID=A0A0L7RBN8_9HYME|nr:hypothetical protein WH47_03383 [Habropoda laboriosa]